MNSENNEILPLKLQGDKKISKVNNMLLLFPQNTDVFSGETQEWEDQ